MIRNLTPKFLHGSLLENSYGSLLENSYEIKCSGQLLFYDTGKRNVGRQSFNNRVTEVARKLDVVYWSNCNPSEWLRILLKILLFVFPSTKVVSTMLSSVFRTEYKRPPSNSGQNCQTIQCRMPCHTSDY